MKNGLNFERFAPFSAFAELGGRGEKNVAGAVQRGFEGVLNDADDETNPDDLHRDVDADSEKGTSERN